MNWIGVFVSLLFLVSAADAVDTNNTVTIVGGEAVTTAQTEAPIFLFISGEALPDVSYGWMLVIFGGIAVCGFALWYLRRRKEAYGLVEEEFG